MARTTPVAAAIDPDPGAGPSRERSLAQRVALNTGSQMAGTLLGIVVSLFFLRLSTSYLGVSSFGDLSIVLSLGGLIITLADLGVSTTLAREIAKHPEQTEELAANLLVFRIAGAAGMVVVAWLAIPFLPYSETTKLALALSLVGVFLTSVGTFPRAFFQVHLQLQRQAMLDLGQKLLNLVAMVAVILVGAHLLALVSLLVAANGVICVWAFRQARPFWRVQFGFRRSLARPLIRDSISIGLVSMVGLLHYRGDAVLLSLLKPAADVGIYTIAYRFIDLAFLLPAFLVGAVFATLTRYAHAESSERRDALVNKVLQILLLSSVATAVALFTLAPSIVRLLVGARFAAAIEPTQILACSLAFIFVSPVFYNLLIAVNRQQQLVTLGLAAVALNVGLNLILIPPYSYNGAAIATVASEGFSFAGTVVLTQRALRLRIDRSFIWRACVAALAAAAVVATLRSANPWLSCFLAEAVLVGLALAFGLVRMQDIAVVARRHDTDVPPTARAPSPDLDPAPAGLPTPGLGAQWLGVSRNWRRAIGLLGSPWLLIVLVAAGVAARIVGWAADRSLWGDEGALALNLIGKSARALLRPLDYVQGAPAGFLLVERLDVRVFGPTELSLRLFPLVAGVLALVFFAAVARRALAPAAAPVAVVLVAASVPLVYYSSEVKQYSTDVLAGVVLLWAALTVDWAGLRLWRVAALSLGGLATVWFSNAALIVLPSLVAVLLVSAWRAGDRRGLRQLAILSVPWAAGSIAAYAVDHGNATRVASAALTTGSQGRLAQVKDVWHFFAQALGVANTATALAVVAALAGFVSLGRRNPRAAALIVAPLTATFLAAVAGRYPFVDRFVLFLAPFVALLIAEGIWAISRRVPLVAVAAAALLLAYPAATSLRNVLRPPGHEEVRTVLRYVEARWRPGDALYVWWQSQFPLRYYADCGPCHVLGPTGPASVVWPRTLAEARGANALVTHPPDLYLGTMPHDLEGYLANFDQLVGKRRAWFVFSSTWDDDFARFALDCLGRRLAEVHATRAAAYLYDLSAKPTNRRCFIGASR
jgi:O-antigen/teichoic acid export membrane protein